VSVLAKDRLRGTNIGKFFGPSHGGELVLYSCLKLLNMSRIEAMYWLTLLRQIEPDILIDSADSHENCRDIVLW